MKYYELLEDFLKRDRIGPYDIDTELVPAFKELPPFEDVVPKNKWTEFASEFQDMADCLEDRVKRTDKWTESESRTFLERAYGFFRKYDI